MFQDSSTDINIQFRQVKLVVKVIKHIHCCQWCIEKCQNFRWVNTTIILYIILVPGIEQYFHPFLECFTITKPDLKLIKEHFTHEVGNELENNAQALS